MAKRKENKERVDLHKGEFTFNEKHPLKYTFFIAFIWFLLGFGIAILGFFLNERGFLWNLNAGMVVGFIISAIWALVKLGVLESSLFKLQNFRDKSFSQKHDVKIKKETREEYASRRRKKPWWGVVALASTTALIFIITTIIQFA